MTLPPDAWCPRCLATPEVACVLCNRAVCDHHHDEVVFGDDTFFICLACERTRFYEASRYVGGCPTRLTPELEAIRREAAELRAVDDGPLPF